VSFANALNEKAQVVGQSVKMSAPQTSRAFLWESGTMLDLGEAAASHTTSEARAINQKGTVVGTSGSGDNAAAWIWRDGTTRDLNALIATHDPNASFVRLQLATGINDKDQIAAQGFDRRRGSSAVRGYLLTPVK
jgi:probable HAF family extracellular repeat protein